MTTDLPAPADILEELADKVVAQIERLAPVAFDHSLDELTTYHRFLLALSASQTPDGSPFSYAEVAKSAWEMPHTRWTKQYNRLFERAANRLPDEDHFIRALAYAPSRLLPGRDEPDLPASVSSAILRLGPIMIHRLEAWVTKRSTVDVAEGEAATHRFAMAGSDAKAYANVLPEIIGAWEHLLRFGPLTMQLHELGGKNDIQRWSGYGACWPLVWQHLSYTAYCLTIAVWNEDEVGANFFREALVSWQHNLEHRFHETALLRHHDVLYPTLLSLDWTDAKRRVEALTYDYIGTPSPDHLFASILRGAHGDVLLLTAMLVLYWSISGKQTSDLGARTARLLLRRQGSEEFDDDASGIELAFRPLFMHLVRLKTAAEHFPTVSYSSVLDGLIEMLDNMTEGPLIPGRGYTPSTLHGKDQLVLPSIAILLATTPDEGDDGLLDCIKTLAHEEKVLPQGDQSLRNVMQELESWRSELDELRPEIVRCVKVLAPQYDNGHAVTKLRAIIQSTETGIEAERIQRLKARPPNPKMLERIRSSIQAALSDRSIEIPFFIDGEVGFVTNQENAVSHDIGFSGVNKAILTDPPMESPPINLEEFLISGTIRRVKSEAWKSLRYRSSSRRALAERVEDEAFWNQLAELEAEIDGDAALAVSRSAEEPVLWRILHGAPEGRPNLTVEKHPQDMNVASYIATINGIHVFGAALSRGEAWLFSTKALQSVHYAAFGETARYVNVTYEAGEQMKGTLYISIRIVFEWQETPIFELSLTGAED